MGNKNTKNKSGNDRGLWLLIIVLSVLLIAAVTVALCLPGCQPEQTPTEPEQTPAEPDVPVQSQTQPSMEEREETTINLGYGLTVTEVGKYTGAYVEDGSDEFVTGVLMLRIMNTGEQDIQYAEITMALAEGEAKFSLSTLPVGEAVILLEHSRMQWDAQEEYAHAVMENVVAFAEPLSLQEDQLKIQILNGGLNVTNISGQDITGDIVIYYKNAQMGLYYGGVTYRVRLEGGLKAGELRQGMSDHLSATGSEIMFVTIG